MKNRFFVWKDGIYNDKNTAWLELSGKEFYKYITRPENRNRQFIKEYYDPYDHKKGFYKMEVTKKSYKKWDAKRKKNNRQEDVLDIETIKNYLSKKDDAISTKMVKSIPTVVSFDSFVMEDSEFTYHDIIPTEENEMDEILINLVLRDVYHMSRLLSVEERELLDLLYFNNPENKSVREIANVNNVSHQLLNYHFEKILKKIKKFFAT